MAQPQKRPGGAATRGMGQFRGSPDVFPAAALPAVTRVFRKNVGWLGQSGESCEPRAPAKLMVKAGARRSFLTPLPQPPARRFSDNAIGGGSSSAENRRCYPLVAGNTSDTHSLHCRCRSRLVPQPTPTAISYLLQPDLAPQESRDPLDDVQASTLRPSSAPG